MIKVHQMIGRITALSRPRGGGTFLFRNSSSSSSGADHAAKHAAAVHDYKTSPQVLANWIDLSVVNVKGRIYPCDKSLLKVGSPDAMTFPAVKAYTLNDDSVSFPPVADSNLTGGLLEGKGKLEKARPRLVAFSFKQYGYGLVRTWLDPFLDSMREGEGEGEGLGGNIEDMQKMAQFEIFELCFVEYGFLAMAKGAFTGNLREKVPEDMHDSVGVVFGGVNDFASQLLLPNKYSGYVFLLDSQNRVRWRGCGMAQDGEVDHMVRCAKALLEEHDL